MNGRWYSWQGDTLVLELRVQARGGSDKVLGADVGRLRVRIATAPVDGRANAHILGLLAKAFRVPRGRVAITRGERSRDKRVEIDAPGAFPGWLPSEARPAACGGA